MRTSLQVASLLSSATEMLYLLGLGESVVGVSHECDFPAAANGKPRVTRSNIDSGESAAAIDAQVKQLLAEGKPLYEVDAELLVSLRPTLIVTQAQCDVCAIKYEDVLRIVAATPELKDVPVVALNPHSLDDVVADLERIAQAAGAAEAGREEAKKLQERIDAVCQQATNIPHEEQPRVACIEWTDPLMLAANWLPEMVAIAGGRHDLTGPGVHSKYASWQNVFDYNPQVMILMPCGFPLTRALAEGKKLSQLEGWSSLAAVKNDRVFAVDANAYFNRPGPRLVETLELLAHFFHPQTFRPPCLQSPAWQLVN